MPPLHCADAVRPCVAGTIVLGQIQVAADINSRCVGNPCGTRVIEEVIPDCIVCRNHQGPGDLSDGFSGGKETPELGQQRVDTLLTVVTQTVFVRIGIRVIRNVGIQTLIPANRRIVLKRIDQTITIAIEIKRLGVVIGRVVGVRIVAVESRRRGIHTGRRRDCTRERSIRSEHLIEIAQPVAVGVGSAPLIRQIGHDNHIRYIAYDYLICRNIP